MKGDSGYRRQDKEKYYTPPWCIDLLLSVEAFNGLTIDPAAGGWHIVEAMRAAGIICDGFDISPDALPDGQFAGETQDFLSWDGVSSLGRAYQNICSNPPFGAQGRLAVQFINHALDLTGRVGGKVAMLLPLDFSAAPGRTALFNDHPAYAAKYEITRRIRWVNLPQKANGPKGHHAWFIWDWAKAPEAKPIHGFLPVTSAGRGHDLRTGAA